MQIDTFDNRLVSRDITTLLEKKIADQSQCFKSRYWWYVWWPDFY